MGTLCGGGQGASPRGSFLLGFAEQEGRGSKAGPILHHAPITNYGGVDSDRGLRTHPSRCPNS